MFRLRRAVSAYPELLIVLVAATVGLTVQRPLAWLTSHDGINALLIVLVFSTAVTIEPAALRRAAASWRPLLITLIIGATVLPALSWLVSRMVSAGSLRDGVMCVGLAPCEIASVATTAMAKGEAALSAGVLIGSTVVTVVIAGPILALESGRASVHPAHIVVNLVLVVALPFVVGLAARSDQAGRRPRRAGCPDCRHHQCRRPCGLDRRRNPLQRSIHRRRRIAVRVLGCFHRDRQTRRMVVATAQFLVHPAHHLDEGFRYRCRIGSDRVRGVCSGAARSLRRSRVAVGNRCCWMAT